VLLAGERGSARTIPAVGKTLDLRLSDPVRETFARVLDGVLALDQGSAVADYLGPNPWGDLGAYQREVFDPMQSGRASVGAEGRQTIRVVMPVQDLPRINSVLYDLYEGYSGGRPWAGIDAEERAIFERLAAQVRR
jgi:hypothetical protein